MFSFSNFNINNPYHVYEFATIAIRLLLIVAAVALLSYVMKSRLMFFAGLGGCFLGYVMPYSTIIRVSGTWSGIVFTHVQHRTTHLLNWGLFGAMAACGIIAAIQLSRNHKTQWSLGSLLLVTAAMAIIVGLCQMEVWWPKD